MSKPGRNDRCTCGSGKKFKLCCLGAASTQPALPSGGGEWHYNRGTALQASGALAQAAASYRAALKQNPGLVEAHINLGNVLQDLGELDAALDCFARALALRPDLYALHLNIGHALQMHGRFEEAVASYRAAMARGVACDARLLNNLGVSLRDAGRLDEAAASFAAALAQEPRSGDLRLGLASVLQAQGRFTEAVTYLRQCVDRDPHSARVHFNLGGLLLAIGQVEEAAQALRGALARDATLADACSALLLCQLYSSATTPEQLRTAHREFADRFAPTRAPEYHATAVAAAAADDRLSRTGRRLRIGYVSADFRAHSVAHFIEPILARHDREAFEVFCYSSVLREDAVTQRLRSQVEHWRCYARRTDEELACGIAQDRIDILVDLSGHTQGNRLLVFARRPAPVQVSWIGYPHPTGLPQIDCFLTDRVASPTCPQDDGADAMLRLPRVFSCYRAPADAPPPRMPGADGAAAVKLGSFNNCAKLSERVVDLWSRLLLRNPGFILLLKDKAYADAQACARMLERFTSRGVTADRVRLHPRIASDASHLALYGEIDIAVDTFPYCGVTTTCEALWMGVPVVTLAGDTFVSRTGASLLQAVDHPEWIATDEDGYIERVCTLAADTAGRARLRSSLRDRMRSSPLMDEAGVTREVEDAYRAVWERHGPADRRIRPDSAAALIG